MNCIKMAGGCKWHYLRDGQTFCGVRGREIDRRELGLADSDDIICGNCDQALRQFGRATRLARKLKKRPPRRTVYRPLHRERFEMSVIHVARTSLDTRDPTD